MTIRRDPATPITLPDRHLPLPGTRNVRDVGGYSATAGRRTRWRTLLRADQLDRIPPDAQSELLGLGIRLVIDLRWPEELQRSPSVFRTSAQIRYRSLPLLSDDPAPYQGLAGMYRHMFDARASQLADVARALLEDDGLPAIIGCAAGKDRTGVAVALLLEAVGVPLDVIVDDYALSAQYFAAPVAHVESDDWRAGPLVVDSPPAFMYEALAHLEEQHGGARALLRRQGLTEGDLDRLVEVLTEPVAGA
jgi:protein-tyrosine phosphatase